MCTPLEQPLGRDADKNTIYYTHFEITGDPCILIGSKQCNLFTGYKSNYFLLYIASLFSAHQNENESMNE